MLEFFSKRKGQKGFTLIELLVVIAIIGILATVVLVSLNTARSKARDTRRMSDLHQVALASEMFYDGASPNAYPSGATWAAVAFGNYLTVKPDDPLNSSPNVYSWVNNAGNTQKFVMCGYLENCTVGTDCVIYVRESGTNPGTTACPAL